MWYIIILKCYSCSKMIVFIHLLTKQIFIFHLINTRHGGRHFGYNSTQDKVLVPMRFYILKQKYNVIRSNCIQKKAVCEQIPINVVA